jgi:nicotinate-nucleotide--dimethylbenzimidazole phosphoribosyltransferase
MSELINKTINSIKPLDRLAMEKAGLRQDSLTKPQGALGRLEEISIKLAGIQAKPIPQIKEKGIITMAADHGIVAEHIGNYPQEVTPQMVLNFVSGGAGINVLARHIGARVTVIDMGVASFLPNDARIIDCKIGLGTANISKGPAMSHQQAVKAIESGIIIVNKEIDNGLTIIGTGDMGIGNTSPSACICASITGKPIEDVTGRGTGLNDDQLAYKISILKRALEKNKPDSSDGIDVLEKVGGFEIGGLTGVILGAAARRIPVVIDGFISGAAALVAYSLSPRVTDYMFAAHLSAEEGHRYILDYIKLKPVVQLDMRLGEGTGAAIAIGIIEGAAKILAEMTTFSEAGVTDKEKE